jgi:hypothetical protein
MEVQAAVAHQIVLLQLLVQAGQAILLAHLHHKEIMAVLEVLTSELLLLAVAEVALVQLAVMELGLAQA